MRSLLAGFQLRGKLCDSEKVFLDEIALPGSLTFLISDRNFLHPEKTPLFTFETIESALSNSRDALFCHQYQPEKAPGTGRYRIHTAVLDTDDAGSCILGLFEIQQGPASDAGKEYFAGLTTQFRHAWTDSRKVITELESLLRAEHPVCLVDQTSNRLLYGNAAAADCLSCSTVDLADRDFDAIRTRICVKTACPEPDYTDRTWNDFSLQIISWNPTVTTGAGREHLLTEYFAHKMRNKICSIITACGHLEEIDTHEPNSEEATMVRMINEQTTELNHEIDRLCLVFGNGSQPETEVSLQTEFDLALAQLSEHQQERVRVPETGLIAGMRHKAKIGAWAALFEAVMQFHSSLHRNAYTTIDSRSANHAAHIVISFVSSLKTERAQKTSAPELVTLIETLAKKTGVEYNYSIAHETHTTSLQFNRQENPGEPDRM
jgi:hypothetical protein